MFIAYHPENCPHQSQLHQSLPTHQPQPQLNITVPVTQLNIFKMAGTSLYDLIIPTFTQGLQTYDHILAEAEKFAKEKGLNVDEVFPQARLIEDQLPLAFQVQNTTKAVQVTIGRLTGVEPTFFENNEKTVADLRQRIQKTLDLVKSVQPDAVNSREGAEVEL